MGRVAQQVELAELGRVFALSTQLLTHRSGDARKRERASLATGALFVPFKNVDGSPATGSNGVSLRGTCGVTFVSPSFAITAAHCVDDARMDTRELIVTMFRPTLRLAERYLVATSLGGTFPNYSHEQLSADDGYLAESFGCKLVARCAADFGGWLGCDTLRITGKPSDVALLKCSAAPGDKYGTAQVATADEGSAEVFMPWKHEIYDVPLDPADDRFQHYSRHYDDPNQNYHYFGRGLDGTEQNQLLPLLSVPFEDGTAHRKLNETAIGVMTDLLGCHGASGSGVWQRMASGEFELLGPVVYGNHELENYLCNHSPSYDGFSRTPGSIGLTYGSLEATRMLLGEYATQIDADCATASDELARAFAPLPCGLAPVQKSPPARFVDATHPLGLRSSALSGGARGRIGFLASCVGGCGALRVTVDGAVVANAPLTGTTENPQAFGAGFSSAPTSSGLVELSLDGAGRARIAALSVVEEGRPLEFDTAAERANVELVDVTVAGAAPTPLRVVGKGSGSAARLESGERLVFTRQALIPEHAVSLRFDVDPQTQLFCGLLSPSGAELSRVDCSTGAVRLAPPATSSSPASSSLAAFYIETARDSLATSIDRVRVVSDLAPDLDGDGIPDLLDDCPRGSLPPSGGLLFTDLGPDQLRVCQPGLQPVRLGAPRPTNACEPASLRGSVVEIRKHAVPVGALPVTADPLELPDGVITARYEILDNAGHSVASVDKTTYVTFYPNEDCCATDQRRLFGSSADELLDYSSLGSVCAITGVGRDLLLSGDGSSYIAAGADDDFVASKGDHDVLLGGEGNDYLRASSHHVVVHAGPGNDTLHATGAGSAVLFGGPGRDVIVGSGGSDEIVPGAGGDWVDAGAGDDTVILYALCELMSGLELHGGEGTDLLRAPATEEAMRQAGVVIDGFEKILVDDSLAALADCSREIPKP